MTILFHFFILAVSFIFVFIWMQTGLSNYTVQMLAALVFLYISISFIRKKRNPKSELFSGSSDIFILNTAILLLISITGNLYSPLFFLVYFLGFGITFIFEPVSVFLFIIGAICVFLPEALKNGSLESYIRLGSIVLISPLAYFFGQQFKQQEEQAERLKDTADTIEKDVREILDTEQSSLKTKDVEKMNEILEEAEELREEAE